MRARAVHCVVQMLARWTAHDAKFGDFLLEFLVECGVGVGLIPGAVGIEILGYLHLKREVIRRPTSLAGDVHFDDSVVGKSLGTYLCLVNKLHL